jgi:undecaprenyl-diphosphatase
MPLDWTALRVLNGFAAHHDTVEDPWMLYVRISEALFLGLVIVLFLAGRAPLRRAAVAAGASGALSLAVAHVLAGAIARPRPFVSDPSRVHLLLAHAPDPGFPSEHATAAFAIATAILLRDRRWGIAALAFAVLLAVGRVAAGVHFPSDVLAGGALGTGTSLVLWAALPRRLLGAVADRLGAPWDRLRTPAQG